MNVRILLLFIFALASTPALAIYKCESAGSVTYSDAPCPGGKQIDVADPVPSAEAARAAERARRQREDLSRIDGERNKLQAQDLKHRNQVARTESAKAKKCAQLALRRKSAQDTVATAPPRGMSKARLKAQRAAERHDLECTGPGNANFGKLS